MTSRAVPGLHGLARLHGVQTAFLDNAGRRRTASPEALAGTLRALGAPLERPTDVPDAIRATRLAAWRRPLEPAVVVGSGPQAGAVVLRQPERAAGMRPEIACRLVPADPGTAGARAGSAPAATGGQARVAESHDAGAERTGATDGAEVAVRSWTCVPEPVGREVVDGEAFVARTVILPNGLPDGYYRLEVAGAAASADALVIVAPTRAYGPAVREWGVFLPLYALRTERSPDAGDLTDLESLADWTASLGGRRVGTLPLLASFLETPFEPSPYAPVSRLFWNEFYVDVAGAPDAGGDVAGGPRTGEAGSRPSRDGGIAADVGPGPPSGLPAGPTVDYRRLMARKRSALEPLARAAFAGGAPRDPDFARFLAGNARLRDYAAFRAACERRGCGPSGWPARQRDGDLRPDDYDEDASRYHLYVQWVADRQLARLADRLYLDLPLGVHPEGYDVWRERAVFATGAAGGAPPDAFFTLGQNWGFPPLHPQAIREDGYRYVIATLRHHLRHAGALRIDHVMSLHRLYWVPDGLAATDGAYVRYPAHELYAVLALESHRFRARIIGEDLGTVPTEVRRAMRRHGVRRMHVVQFEVDPGREPPLRPAPRRAVASLNTHDMPPFAAFWRAADVEDRRALGLLDEDGARTEVEARERLRGALVRLLAGRGLLDGDASARSTLEALLAHLAAGPAELVLVNLEDLWLEPRPQNVPGTTTERPNWRRGAAYALERFRRMPEVVDPLRRMDALRRRGSMS